MKYLSILFSLFLSTIVTQSYATVADISVENDDGVIIYYNYINDGMELEVTCSYISGWTSSSDYSGNVNIPEEVTYMNRTRKVTAIGHYAFQSCGSLTSVTIPSSVTSIDFRAFKNCGISNIIIPPSVTFIGNGAFSGCSLTSVTIPNSVTSIGDNAFEYCRSLSSVTIGSSVTSIGDNAFYDCRSLSSVTIGSSVTSIGKESFCGCSSLTSITIPSSVTFVGEEAFKDCSSLTEIHISDVAAWCNIKYYNSNSNPLYYVHHLYLNGEEVKDLVIPNGVKNINTYAFYGCKSLTSVVIPNSVTSIGYQAFRDCTNLTSVTIGNNVTFREGGCQTFDGSKISTVICLNENPSEIIGRSSGCRTFSQDTFLNATLYVPKGTIEKYKETEGWKDFLWMEEGLPSNINIIDNVAAKEKRLYYIDGKVIDNPQKGINVIQMDNGTTKKVLVK